MPIACPVDLNTAVLRSEISSIYGRVAAEPDGEFHFHRGPAYAAEFLGYDAGELAALPADCTASFAGVGNPLAIGPIHAGETVLDIGCGAGMDLLLAAKRTGPDGHAIGVDMTDAMIERARKSAATAACAKSKSARAMPLLFRSPMAASMSSTRTASLTWSPRRNAGFAEIVRVLKPGGRLHLAELPWMSNSPRTPAAISTLDRLNRRCSAGGRARYVSGADRPGGRPNHRTF